MAGRRFHAAAIALLPVTTIAAAQDYRTTAPGFGAEGGLYVEPAPTVPPGACVWGNVVYSDGAIIERPQQPHAFFRCVRGSWRSFDSFDAARAGRELAPEPPRSGSALQPPRSRPR